MPSSQGLSNIRLGVVGVGSMGEMHCRVANQIRALELVGVHDSDSERAAQIAQRYGVATFRSLDEMYPLVDAIVVATPTTQHVDIACAALGRGLSVLVEKPVAPDLDGARRIVEAARRGGAICAAGHIERHNPTFIELCRVIGGQRPLAVNARRLNMYAARVSDTDVTLDLLIHDMDLLMTLMGQEPTSLQATGMSLVTPGLDHVDVLATFADGSTAAVTASRVTEDKIRRIEVVANGRYVLADLLRRTLTIHRKGGAQWEVAGAELRVTIDSLVEHVQVPAVEPLFAELHDFALAVRDRRPPLVPIDQGARALEFTLRVQDLARGSMAKVAASA